MSPRKIKPPLTKERLFQAALELVDREGLDALTMRRLGTELGVEAMSLYYHVPNKAAVLEGVAELVLSRIQIEERESEDWIRTLREALHDARRVFTSHPNVIPLLMITPSPDQTSRGLVEMVLRLLARGGMEPVEAHRAFRILLAFLFGHAMSATVRPTEEEIQAQVEELGRMQPGFPLLRTALTAPGHLDPEGDFELGVDLLLDALRRRAEGD